MFVCNIRYVLNLVCYAKKYQLAIEIRQTFLYYFDVVLLFIKQGE